MDLNQPIRQDNISQEFPRVPGSSPCHQYVCSFVLFCLEGRTYTCISLLTEHIATPYPYSENVQRHIKILFVSLYCWELCYLANMEFSKTPCPVRHSLRYCPIYFGYPLIIYFNVIGWLILLLGSLFNDSWFPKFMGCLTTGTATLLENKIET